MEDFGWIKASHSPNWSLLPEGERMAPIRVPWGALAAAEAVAGGGRQQAGAAVNGEEEEDEI